MNQPKTVYGALPEMTEIARWLAKGSGPAQLRARLVWKTRAVRGFATPVSALQEVRAGIPGSVTGEALVGLVSSRLRELLEGEEPPAVPEQDPQGHRPDFAAPKGVKLGIQAPSDPPPLSQPGTPREGRFSPSAASQRQTAWFNTPQAQDASQSGASSFASLPPLPHAVAGAVTEMASSNTWQAASSDQISAHLHRPALTSLLALQVAEYFAGDSSQKEPTPSPRPEISPQPFPPAQHRSSMIPVPFPSGVKSGARAWPELTGKQLADRLQAFVSGIQPSSTADPAVPQPAVPERAEIQNVFHIQVGSPASSPASLQDLSDQVADILREQAIQHGIDIT